MRMLEQVLDVPADRVPSQYAAGELCREGCGTRLSVYNRYTVCGPCRLRLSTRIPRDVVDHADDVEAAGFVWERFPRREPVRRGPLLDETRDFERAG